MMPLTHAAQLTRALVDRIERAWGQVGPRLDGVLGLTSWPAVMRSVGRIYVGVAVIRWTIERRCRGEGVAL